MEGLVELLTLSQWLSPAYPVGAFAYSHGLETAIATGRVRDVASLEAWLSDILQDGSGRVDAVLLSEAYRAERGAPLRDVNDVGCAFASSAERLRESAQQGAAFARTTRAVWGLDVPDMLFPVAVGCAARQRNLDLVATSALYLQAFASNLVSAAVRLVPLGQTDGQRVLAALGPLCDQIARDAATTDIEALWSNSWVSDIAAMQHETMEPRLFQS